MAYHRQNVGMIYSELCLLLVSRMDYHTPGPCEWRGDTPLDQFVLLSCTAVVAAAPGPGTPFAQVAKLHTAEPTPQKRKTAQ